MSSIEQGPGAPAQANELVLGLEDRPRPLIGLLAALLVVVRHKDNIIRLMHGKELKVERIKKK